MLKIKKALLIVLCLVIFLSTFNLTAYAKTVYTDAEWSYVMVNDYTQLEIDSYHGTGTIASTYLKYSNMPIISIADYVFCGNNTLKEIRINSPIEKIKNYVFLNCTNLETVVLSNTVETIGSYSFSGCSSLVNVNLENTKVTNIKKATFKNCISLNEIIVPDTVSTIGDYAFADCTNLEKVVIPDSIITISNTAFHNSKNVVIYCYEDSTAHTYAVENGIEYVLMEPPRTYILGDIDCDGEITVMDATRIQLILVERIKDYTEEDVIRGDIERDGVLSIMDVTSIQRYSASYDDGLGIGETFEF